ncbi:MAG: hypothetical protein JWO20_520 [Candidatus Angelobacter sp.]|nr:hypothetical protein [Candidatus Angelobacter sp.]
MKLNTKNRPFASEKIATPNQVALRISTAVTAINNVVDLHIGSGCGRTDRNWRR